MLTVFASVVFFASSLINIFIFLVIWDIPGMTKKDWFFVTFMATAWVGSATYLFGFF
jgi:hypothetical protein